MNCFAYPPLASRNIDRSFFLAFKMLRKEIYQPPIEIFVHISETMTLSRKNQHFETLISPDHVQASNALSIA